MKFWFRLNRSTGALAAAALLSAPNPAAAANTALTELIELLRDKGTLSESEYELLVDAARADESRVTGAAAEAEQVGDAKIAADDDRQPAWTETITLKGDLRTRYQYQEEDGRPARGRGRLRYRLGIVARPAGGWEVGAGLASGGSDLRSSNQSFDETFSTKGINLDYAYMQYDFGNGLRGIAGKFSWKDYLYAPTDVMWDSDINPEGFSASYHSANAWGSIFANAGIWVMEENAGSSDDPFLAYGQLGQSWESNAWFGTLAAAVYGFADVDTPGDFTPAEGTNTDGDLSSFNLNAEFGYAFGAHKLRLLGEYIHNFETDTPEDSAWAVGAKYSLGRWGFKYVYADVDANAVPDFLPDSDRFDGLTDIYGHELELKYALNGKASVALDFYAVENDATGAEQRVLQADLNLKF